MHFFFNGSGEWEQWDITEQVSGLTISGDPVVSPEGNVGLRPAGRQPPAHCSGSTNATNGSSTTCPTAPGDWLVTGDPALAPDARNVFVRRADNHLAHFYLDDEDEWQAADLGGWVVGRPALSPDGRVIYLRRADNHLAQLYPR